MRYAFCFRVLYATKFKNVMMNLDVLLSLSGASLYSNNVSITIVLFILYPAIHWMVKQVTPLDSFNSISAIRRNSSVNGAAMFIWSIYLTGVRIFA